MKNKETVLSSQSNSNEYDTKSVKNMTNSQSTLSQYKQVTESFEEAPLWAAIITYMGYLLLNIFGWFRDSLRYVGIEKKKGAKDNNPSVNNFPGDEQSLKFC
jgi:hypothetical protein